MNNEKFGGEGMKESIPREELEDVVEQEVADPVAEKIQSWERTFDHSLYGQYYEADQFERSVEAFISNAKNYSNPERSDTGEGDNIFYERITKLERLYGLCKEGYDWPQISFLLSDTGFEREELNQKLEYYFSKFYTKK